MLIITVLFTTAAKNELIYYKIRLKKNSKNEYTSVTTERKKI